MVLVAALARFGRFAGIFLFLNFLLVIAEAVLVFAEAELVFAHDVGGSLGGPQVTPSDVAHFTFGHTHSPFSSRVVEEEAKVDASTQWAGTGKAGNTKVPSVVAEHAVWQTLDVGKQPLFLLVFDG